MISENDIIFDNLASEVFPYLDELRRTGEVNMYDSPTYVQDDFNVDKYMARKLVQTWMHDYDPEIHEHPLGTGFAQKDNK